jgi:hypothetical protein
MECHHGYYYYFGLSLPLVPKSQFPLTFLGTFVYHDYAVGQSHESENKPTEKIDWSVLRLYKIICIVVVLGVILHISDANNPLNFETGGTTSDEHSHSH